MIPFQHLIKQIQTDPDLSEKLRCYEPLLWYDPWLNTQEPNKHEDSSSRKPGRDTGHHQEGDPWAPWPTSRLRFLRCLCRARHARALRPRTATLSFFSRTPILGLARASAGGLHRAAGLFSSSTLWMRYCALRCRASSASTLSTLAYPNGVDARRSSIFGSWRSNATTARRKEEGSGEGLLAWASFPAVAGCLAWDDVCASTVI